MKSPFQQKNGNFASGVKGGLAWCTKLLCFSDPITLSNSGAAHRSVCEGVYSVQVCIPLDCTWGPADIGVLCSVTCFLCGRHKKNYRQKKLNVNDLANRCKPTTLDHCIVN